MNPGQAPLLPAAQDAAFRMTPIQGFDEAVRAERTRQERSDAPAKTQQVELSVHHSGVASAGGSHGTAAHERAAEFDVDPHSGLPIHTPVVVGSISSPVMRSTAPRLSVPSGAVDVGPAAHAQDAAQREAEDAKAEAAAGKNKVASPSRRGRRRRLSSANESDRISTEEHESDEGDEEEDSDDEDMGGGDSLGALLRYYCRGVWRTPTVRSRATLMTGMVLTALMYGLAVLLPADATNLYAEPLYKWAALFTASVTMYIVLKVFFLSLREMFKRMRYRLHFPTELYLILWATTSRASGTAVALFGKKRWAEYFEDADDPAPAVMDAIWDFMLIFSVVSMAYDWLFRMTVIRLDRVSHWPKTLALAQRCYVVFCLQHHGCEAHCTSILQGLLSLPLAQAMPGLTKYFISRAYLREDGEEDHYENPINENDGDVPSNAISPEPLSPDPVPALARLRSTTHVDVAEEFMSAVPPPGATDRGLDSAPNSAPNSGHASPLESPRNPRPPRSGDTHHRLPRAQSSRSSSRSTGQPRTEFDKNVKAMVDRIWRAFRRPKVLTEEDFRDCLRSDPRLIRVAMDTFDLTGSGAVTRREATIALRGFLRSRKYMSKNLVDFRHSVHQVLERVFTAGFWIVVFLAVLAIIFEQDFESVTLTTSAILLGLTFLAGSVVKDWGKAAAYILINHPFDVGDWIAFGEGEWPLLITSIQPTVTAAQSMFGKTHYYENHILADLPELVNLSRSGPGTVHIPLALNMETPPKKLQELEARLQRYVERRNLYWKSMQVFVQPPSYDKFWIVAHIFVTHRRSWADLLVYHSRTHFVHKLREVLQELGLEWQPISQPVTFTQAGSLPAPVANVSAPLDGSSRSRLRPKRLS